LSKLDARPWRRFDLHQSWGNLVIEGAIRIRPGNIYFALCAGVPWVVNAAAWPYQRFGPDGANDVPRRGGGRLD
jgi:hypothetical protein